MITVDWPNKVIYIPQSYLTSLGGDIYELDTEQLRLDLKDAEDSEIGIAYEDTHRRNAPVTISGATYAQTLEIINGYTVTFEDGQYAVNFVGSNNNIYDVTNVNQVSLRPSNSAGLIQVTSGSGVLPSDVSDIADAVWDELLAGHQTLGSAGQIVEDAGDNAEVTQGKIDQL